MKRLSQILLLTITTSACFSQQNIPLWDPNLTDQKQPDWLIEKPSLKAEVYRSADGKFLTLFNGLMKRQFVLAPNLACIDFQNMANSQQLLRAIKPEAIITVNGKRYNIGGLNGQKEKAYFLNSWLGGLTTGDTDFQYLDMEATDLLPFIKTKPTAWPNKLQQPSGKTISFRYGSPLPELRGLEVKVHYELYDFLPLVVKYVSIENSSDHAFQIGPVINEVLGLVEEESAVVGRPDEMKKQHGLYVETNYAFNNAMRYDISDQTTHWKTDSTYTSQVNYNYETPCVLEVYPANAKQMELKAGAVLNSVRTHELLMDSYDRERRGLAIRKMYRTVAPWVVQNPIFMHLVSRDDKEVITAIEQCAATGYEALILSFGSHCAMEDTSRANVDKWKKIAEYAHSKNILIGSYSLFSSRRISDEDDVISAKTGKPGGAFFGNAPCFGSVWGLAYRDKIKYFMTSTKFDIWENDGPYPGDVCASVNHPGHKGLDDSQWRQMEIQKELYHCLNQHGVYINAPDWYFLDGTHKIAIGYREVNFSLSRDQQKILNRQNIFDGTWEKTPSMGWGFVPLTRYQGGGPEAVLEPLNEHRKDYEQLMMQYYGAGVQACYRGPRLFDTDSTREMVTKTVTWYKKYRDILNADIIHLRRPDGRDWDGILHVDPTLKTKGLLMLFNPTKEAIKRTIQLPLYYAKLNEKTRIRQKEEKSKPYSVNKEGVVEFTFLLPAEGYSWYVIE